MSPNTRSCFVKCPYFYPSHFQFSSTFFPIKLLYKFTHADSPSSEPYKSLSVIDILRTNPLNKSSWTQFLSHCETILPFLVYVAAFFRYNSPPPIPPKNNAFFENFTAFFFETGVFRLRISVYCPGLPIIFYRILHIEKSFSLILESADFYRVEERKRKILSALNSENLTFLLGCKIECTELILTISC